MLHLSRSCRRLIPNTQSIIYLCQYSSRQNYIQNRSIVYLKDGVSRARGLKKQDEEYLTAANGIKYPGTQETLQPTKEFLGDAFKLSDDLILQTITHKSFAHGKRPFNESLSILGKEFLRLETGSFAVNQESSNPSRIANANFDISPNAVELLSSVKAIAEVSKRAGIANCIFWKKRADGLSPKQSGEVSVHAKTIAALVGAILVTHGQTKASDFIKTKLLAGPYSLLDIAKSIYEK